jgi:polyisoprenoid-binding protein YceI
MYLPSLALTIVFTAAPASAQVLSVASPNGRFVAEASPTPAPRDPKTGEQRCDLAVYELRPGAERVPQWRGLYDYRGDAAGHFLSDDGSTFAHVDDRELADRAIVRVIRRGLALAMLDASALHVVPRPDATPRPDAAPRGDAGSAPTAPSTPTPPAIDRATTWIDLAPSCCRMREVATVTSTSRYLDLLGRDGALRTIDLSSGALAIAPDLRPEIRPRLDRALNADAQKELEPPFVQSIAAPPLAFAGEPLAIEITGNFPSAGWELQGFDLAPDARVPDRFVITPLARPPSGASAQVMRPFRAGAKLLDLCIGTYAIGARGHDYARPVADTTVEIAPRNLVISMKSGASASPRTLALVADGRFVDLSARNVRPRVVLAPIAAARDIERLVGELDPAWAKTTADAERPSAAERAPRAGEIAASERDHDSTTREFVWISGTSLVRVVRDESALEPALRRLSAKLEELARPASVRYAIDATKSRVALRTSSSGLLSAFGHDHTIEARVIEGFIDARPDDLDHASIELSIRADSLVVVDKASQGDRSAIEKEMRENVLETARYPEIHFKSASLATRPLGLRTREVTLAGDLDLHGMRRTITIQGRIGIEDDEIEARGELELRQSEFGIRPTSAAGGTIKVDDVVKLEFDLRARPRR